MSALIIDYSELQTIATNATSLASKAENYCNELNSTVYKAFDSVTAGVNDVLSSAMYYVAAKQKSLTEKAEEYARFAGNVCTLIEHAKQADQDVATKIENNQEDFLKKHSEIQAAEGIEAFLLNLFVEVKNACPLFEIVADCYIAVFDTLDSAFDALKYFYECGGGKELLNIVIAVAVAVVAVATFIACFPLSLAFSWAGLVALATVIGSGIAAVNAITDVLTSTRALESRLNGDPAWASIYGKQDKFSDVLRDTNFGSGTLNKLSYGAATTIDTVETVCDVICVADMAKEFYKAGPNFSEKLGLENNIDNTPKIDASDVKEPGTIGDTFTTLEKKADDSIIRDGSHINSDGTLKPNVKYTTGEHEYIYTTNENGFINSAHADKLEFKTHAGRLKHESKTLGKLKGDHAGHLFGDRFGGSPKLDNLVSQAQRVNASEYKVIENQWAKAIKEGKDVSVDIFVNYSDLTGRPSSFDVSYVIDGIDYFHTISN